MARMVRAPSTAAANARSTSDGSAFGTVSMTELSNGLWTSIFSGLSSQLPATNIFMARLRELVTLANYRVALERGLVVEGYAYCFACFRRHRDAVRLGLGRAGCRCKPRVRLAAGVPAAAASDSGEYRCGGRQRCDRRAGSTD